MRISLLVLCSLCLSTATLQSAPALLTATPGNSLLATPTGPSVRFGSLITFDALTPNTSLASGAFSAQGISSLSSPDGLSVIPYSTQSFPNEIFDASANGSANLTIMLSTATNKIGIGIADSDPVSITFEALKADGTVLGAPFSVNILTSGDPKNPGNGYYILSDTSYDIFGVKLLEAAGNANYSGLAIDDLQVNPIPEPTSLALLGAGALILGVLRSRKIKERRMRSFLSITTSAALLLSVAIHPTLTLAGQSTAAATATTTTPIQHVVVIFGENISFDHYFGTYPKAQNPPGQPHFTAASGTPTVNGLTAALLTNNPNLNPLNGAGASNPFRLNRNQALTASQNHNYGPEQASFDFGLMDLFPLKTGAAGGTPNVYPPVVNTKGLVMGYYDGNTVTAYWNYAQRFALNDNSYNTQFGPSTPGAINLISGQTNGINAANTLNGPPSAATSYVVADGQGNYTVIGDSDPLNDTCSASTRFQNSMTGKNIGDALTAAGLSWGWFMGGFDLTIRNANGTTGCARSTVSPVTGLTVADYVPHHQPFQYYPSTTNPNHTRPTNVTSIGLPGDAANHQYDTHDFFDAVAANNLPAVSYLKAPAYQDGHPGNSNPLDEQAFVVSVLNTLQQSPFWNATAVIIAYDDSDGWYDHQMGSLVNASFSNLDALTGTGACGTAGVTPQLSGPNSNGLPVNGRCGYGVRTPLLVISPWAKANFVDHTLTDQTSVLRFIEDNWKLGRIGGGSFDTLANPINAMFDFTPATPGNAATLLLSPTTGLPQ